MRRGLGRMVARTAVVAGTATVVSGKVHQHQQAKQDAENPEAPPAVAEAGADADAGDDVVSQLKELAALHTAGVLSDEEFASAKAKLLA